jgi:hypothetical protein
MADSRPQMLIKKRAYRQHCDRHKDAGHNVDDRPGRRSILRRAGNAWRMQNVSMHRFNKVGQGHGSVEAQSGPGTAPTNVWCWPKAVPSDHPYGRSSALVGR